MNAKAYTYGRLSYNMYANVRMYFENRSCVIYNRNQNTPGVKKVAAKNLKKAVLKKM